MNHHDDPPFAAWLNATMQARGLSQAAVAREVGVADAQVSRWRRGRVTPTVRYLQRIAETFGVPRTSLDRMAGYPVGEEEGEINPQLEAELQAHAARFRRLMEETVPEALWRAYVESCEALAESLRASFEEARRRAEQELDRSRRQIGFHTEE